MCVSCLPRCERPEVRQKWASPIVSFLAPHRTAAAAHKMANEIQLSPNGIITLFLLANTDPTGFLPIYFCFHSKPATPPVPYTALLDSWFREISTVGLEFSLELPGPVTGQSGTLEPHSDRVRRPQGLMLSSLSLPLLASFPPFQLHSMKIICIFWSAHSGGALRGRSTLVIIALLQWFTSLLHRFIADQWVVPVYKWWFRPTRPLGIAPYFLGSSQFQSLGRASDVVFVVHCCITTRSVSGIGTDLSAPSSSGWR